MNLASTSCHPCALESNRGRDRPWVITRLPRCALLMVTGLWLVSLTGCLTAPSSVSAWEYFDACPEQTPFHDWVTCGKVNRQAACDTSRNCSPGANTIVAYAEGLDQSVQRHEITEPEARRKWVEFRKDREARQDAAKRQSDRTAAERAAATVSEPVFCSTKSMGC
jgi:hypothetical protein